MVALDLPGNGFSDKYTEEVVEGPVGILGRFKYVYSEIQEKGFSGRLIKLSKLVRFHMKKYYLGWRRGR